MNDIASMMRHRRYVVKDNARIELQFTTPAGETLTGQIQNCSTGGTAVKIEGYDPTDFSIGDIFPAAKIKIDDKELGLGRIVLRRLTVGDGTLELAFSTIDQRIPIETQLSKFLEWDEGIDQRAYDLDSQQFNLSHFVEREFPSADLFTKVNHFEVFHKKWSLNAKFGYRNVRSASKGTRIQMDRSRKGGRTDYLMMASNDYLGLAAHPEVLSAIKSSIDKYGFGSTGSGVSTGITELHEDLCQMLARMHKKEAAILFNSGYAANMGVIPAIVRPNDLVVADQLSHASIQDAVQLSKSSFRLFKHNNMNHLEEILQRDRENYNGCLIITEGVFSMDGDIPPLDKIHALAKKYNARVMVDQAHCFGVVGPNGLGACEKYGLLEEVDIIMGTFSKIAGGIGGFIAGSSALIEWLRFFGRSQMFSVTMPPSCVAGVIKALELSIEQPELRDNLKKNIKHFCDGLKTLGYSFSHPQESAVIPVVIKDEEKLGIMYQSMLEDGVIAIPVVYPVVSRKNCRFRFTIMANHTIGDLDYAISSLEKAMLKADFQFQNDEDGIASSEAQLKAG